MKSMNKPILTNVPVWVRGRVIFPYIMQLAEGILSIEVHCDVHGNLLDTMIFLQKPDGQTYKFEETDGAK